MNYSTWNPTNSGICLSVLSWSKSQTNTQTHKHTNRQTDKHTNGQTQTHKHTNRQTHKHTNTQTDKHTNGQTNQGENITSLVEVNIWRDICNSLSEGPALDDAEINVRCESNNLTHRHTLCGTQTHTLWHTDTHSVAHRHLLCGTDHMVSSSLQNVFILYTLLVQVNLTFSKSQFRCAHTHTHTHSLTLTHTHTHTPW